MALRKQELQLWHTENGHALQRMLRIYAQVERDGELREVMADGVLPGDIVWLESGNRVPADVRLLSAQGLEVYESPLTRESFAVTKDASWVGSGSTTLACPQNMAFVGAIERPLSPGLQ